ncbi:MAG: hypothetical protein RRB13_12705 [bacterium]|nr:hypothetical protein [bacterium]
MAKVLELLSWMLPEQVVLVPVVIVEAVIASLKVIWILVLIAILVAEAAGLVLDTVGAVVSASDPVVKPVAVVNALARVLPAESVAPVVTLIL